MSQNELPTMVAEADEYERVYDAIKQQVTALTLTDEGRAIINLISPDGELVPLAEFVPVVPETR
jgi:hypothetical protein